MDLRKMISLSQLNSFSCDELGRKRQPWLESLGDSAVGAAFLQD
jgi:hypothetical protein